MLVIPAFSQEPADGSLYAHTCHGNDNQQFYMVEHERLLRFSEISVSR